MTDCVIRACCALLTIFIIRRVDSVSSEGGLPSHCLQMTTNNGVNAIDILPSYLNDSDFFEPPKTANKINIHISSNNSLLKFSWKMRRTNGVRLKLCYRMKSVYNGRLLFSNCATFDVLRSRARFQMTCWFPVQRSTVGSVLSVVATNKEPTRRSKAYYGELKTVGLDGAGNCGDLCDTKVLKIPKVTNCEEKSFILHNDYVTINSLTFDATDSNVCEDTSVRISKRTPSKAKFFLNCNYEGLGHIIVYFSVHGCYCAKYTTVRVICESVPTNSPLHVTPDSDVNNSQTAIIFVITAPIITMIAVIGVVTFRLRNHYIQHRDSNETAVSL